MSKFKNFLLEAFTSDNATLGGTLKLPNIYYTQGYQAPVGGYTSISQAVQTTQDRKLQNAMYKPTGLSYYITQQSLARIAEIANEIVESKVSGTKSGLGMHDYIDEAIYDSAKDMIYMVGPQAFSSGYGHGSMSAGNTIKVGQVFLILTQNKTQSNYHDLNIQKLRLAIPQVQKEVQTFTRSAQGKGYLAQGADSIMQSMLQTKGGVEQTPNINPFHAG